MMEFNTHFSTSQKVWAGFVLTILVVLMLSSAAMEVSFDYHDTVENYKKQLEGTVALAEAESALWRLRYGVPQFMVMSADEQQKIVAEEPRLYRFIEERLNAYAAGNLTPEELLALETLRSEYHRYIKARPEWFKLYAAGKHQEAAEYRAKTTTPFGVATVTAFDQMLSQQRDVTKERYNTAMADVHFDRQKVVPLCIVIIALIVIWTYFVHRSLGLVRQMRKSAQATIRELFSRDIEIRTTNELDATIQSFDLMRQEFIAHTRELLAARDALNTQQSFLEDSVQQRTFELSETLQNQERQTKKVVLLNDMADRLQSCLDSQEAGSVIALFASRLFPNEAGSIYMLKSSRNLYDTFSGWGVRQEGEFPPFIAPPDCWGLRRGKTHVVLDQGKEIVCAHVDQPLRSPYLCLPLMAHGEIIGLLHLELMKSMADVANLATLQAKERLAEAVAGQIGLSMANLSLRDSLRQQSIRDPLTSLYNRRYMEETLERETARLQRNRSRMAIIMMDIDHFKRFNDTFGHTAGDFLLQAVAKVIMSHLRKEDIPCRFGGEEFVMIVVDADLETAMERADFLREAIQALDVVFQGQTLAKVTASFGVGELPLHGETWKPVLELADEAMYRAKHEGRNRVMRAKRKELS